jgi:hypothetical protein
MPDKTRSTIYTIVQHSAAGYKGDDTFAQGLEIVEVSGAGLIGRIVSAGGKVFSAYNIANSYCMDECYPPGHQGMIPKAPGTFHPVLKVHGLKLYIPAK